METPDRKDHGYDDEREQEAYEETAADDQDAGPASEPDAEADPADQDDD